MLSRLCQLFVSTFLFPDVLHALLLVIPLVLRAMIKHKNDRPVLRNLAIILQKNNQANRLSVAC